MEAVLIAAIAATPPFLVALAGLRRTKKIEHQTNGLLHEPLQEIRTAVLDSQTRLTRVENVVLDHLKFHK